MQRSIFVPVYPELTSWQATQYICPCLSWSSIVEHCLQVVASIRYPFRQFKYSNIYPFFLNDMNPKS